MSCSWETEQERAGANVMESERAKVGLVLTVDDNLNNDVSLQFVSLLFTECC